VYKPLLKVLHDRRAKIEKGLLQADEAEQRLHEVDLIGKEKIKHAENEAVGILKKTELDAKTLEEKLLAEVMALHPVSPITSNFLRILLQHNRIGFFQQIMEQYG